LVKSRGQLVTKKELFAVAWQDTFVEETNLIVTMSVLRRALGDEPESPRYIATVPRKGYRFIHPVRAAGTATASGPGPTLVGLPFRNVGSDPDLDYASDGLTESILDRLSSARGLRVIAKSSVARYRGKNVDAEKVGRTLGATAALLGSLQRYRRRLIVD